MFAQPRAYAHPFKNPNVIVSFGGLCFFTTVPQLLMHPVPVPDFTLQDVDV
jgi:hypothetical protein